MFIIDINYIYNMYVRTHEWLRGLSDEEAIIWDEYMLWQLLAGVSVDGETASWRSQSTSKRDRT